MQFIKPRILATLNWKLWLSLIYITICKCKKNSCQMNVVAGNDGNIDEESISIVNSKVYILGQ
jgi:hypothetical protein